MSEMTVHEITIRREQFEELDLYRQRAYLASDESGFQRGDYIAFREQGRAGSFLAMRILSVSVPAGVMTGCVMLSLTAAVSLVEKRAVLDQLAA